MCIWSQQGARTCAINIRHERNCSSPSVSCSPVAQLVKNLPAMQEIWVRLLGWEDPLEKGKATHSGRENSMDRGAWQATVLGVTKSQTRLSDFNFILFISLCLLADHPSAFPPPLPPPSTVSNSSCPFTQYQPLYWRRK